MVFNLSCTVNNEQRIYCFDTSFSMVDFPHIHEGVSHDVSILSPLSVILTNCVGPIEMVSPFKTDKGPTKGCSRPYKKGIPGLNPRVHFMHLGLKIFSVDLTFLSALRHHFLQ